MTLPVFSFSLNSFGIYDPYTKKADFMNSASSISNDYLIPSSFQYQVFMKAKVIKVVENVPISVKLGETVIIKSVAHPKNTNFSIIIKGGKEYVYPIEYLQFDYFN